MLNKTSPIPNLFLSLALAACLAGCGSKNAPDPGRLQALEQQNAALQAQVQELSAQLNGYKSAALDHWEMTALPGDTPDEPVSLQFTAVPGAYVPGQEARLEVTRNGRQECSIPCQWDGTAYSAQCTLDPANGYGYYCLLSVAEKQTRITLSTPDDPQEPLLTYLEASLDSRCELVVEGWYAQDGILTLTDGTGIVQLPLLTSEGNAAQCTAAQLILMKDGAVLDTQDVPTTPGDTQGSLYALIHDVNLSIPATGPEDQLDLYLRITLNTGAVLTSSAVSWYGGGDGLEPGVG